jgi:hypothetical protein
MRKVGGEGVRNAFFFYAFLLLYGFWEYIPSDHFLLIMVEYIVCGTIGAFVPVESFVGKCGRENGIA